MADQGTVYTNFHTLVRPQDPCQQLQINVSAWVFLNER